MWQIQFCLPRFRRSYGKQRLLYQGLAEWNSIEKSTREMRSLLLFKASLEDCSFLTHFYPVILLNILILYFLTFNFF